MCPGDLVVHPRPQPFTPPLTSPPLFQTIPFLLFCDVLEDGQEPRLAKRYWLDRLSPAVQQQVASEACNRHFFYQLLLAERLSQMVNTLLQRATTQVAFEHGHITPFSVDSSRLGAGILNGIKRYAVVPAITLVDLPFYRGST